MREHPTKGGYRMHNGVDLAMPFGAPIKALLPGTVVANSYQANGAGNYIKIRNADGTYSLYMHMKSRSPLKVGQRIMPGQVIGAVGATGDASGPHLHLELRDANGHPFDPMPLLNNLAHGRGAIAGGIQRMPLPSMGAVGVSGKALGRAPRLIQDWISEAQNRYGVRTELIAAIMDAESNFNYNARSGAGAVGLMQLMPFHRDKGNIYDPKTNVMIGAQILRGLLHQFPDVRMAIAAYNCGAGRVSSLLKKYGHSWDAIAPHLPPETKKYVPKVLSYL